MDKDRLAYLFRRYITKQYNEAEKAELMESLRQEDAAQWLEKYSNETEEMPYTQRTLDDATTQSILKSLLVVIKNENNGRQAPVHRIPSLTGGRHIMKKALFRYAAAVIIIAGIGAYLYINNQKEEPSVTQKNPVPVQNDVAPGGNRATLTLADGSKIILDSAKSGELAREENATISKTADGKIVYDPNEKLADKILLNTMTTPRGGQYQLMLPDGSQVWLNAESSITYPTTFGERERERRVSVTGEVYFEVAKNKARPFIVSVSSGEGRGEKGEGRTLQIEVLGTHFNVNAYKEEQTKNITLLEGSVRIALSALRSPLSDKSVLTLKPGQQGQLSANKLSLAANPDIEQVMAWKNGRFKFGEGMEIAAILRQVSRWYDVDITYEGKVTGTIGGSLSRQVNISKVLELMQSTGSISYRIEGKRVVILPPK
jgi:ferric-dicitrate binding protein FerR (iron transport regulator)